MAKHVVAKAGEIPVGGRLIVDLQGRSIGIFNVAGRLYGVLNRCPHQGAELCRGSVLGQLEAAAPGELEWSGDRPLLQCPWHGWEYDLATGESHFDSRVRPYPVGREQGATVAAEVEAGEATAVGRGRVATGLSAPALSEGPLVAETYPVEVEDEYVVITLPGSAGIDAVVSEVADVADGVRQLTLARESGAPLPGWEPGAHIDLVLPSGLERQYSLCGDPADRFSWQIAVLREPDGRGGSEWIHTELEVGQRVALRGPRNHFHLVEAEAYVFVAGGIGITPLIPMIARLHAEGAGWELLYGGRTLPSMAFAERLAELGPVTLWPQDKRGLLQLERLLSSPREGVAIYCCGPEPLLEAVEAYAARWPEGALHLERFHPRPGALDGPSTAFELVLQRSGKTIAVGAEESAAEAMEAAGIDVPTSCREGTCGTCEIEVLEGEVDHRDSFLTPQERAESKAMMVCCSRARSSRLVLDA